MERRRNIRNNFAFERIKAPNFYDRENSAAFTQLKYNVISDDWYKTQALFECVDCKYTNNADVVGAINILERGYRLLACGEMASLSRSKKQEPTEVESVSF